MSMRILPLALLALMLLPAAASAETLADTSVGFSADRVLVIDGHRYVGKIWAIPGEERHEQAIEAFRPIFLLHSGSPLAEIVVPQLKTVVEFVMPRELHLLESPELRKHPVGHDTVNGIATTRYTIDQSLPEGHASGLSDEADRHLDRQEGQGGAGQLGIEPRQGGAAAARTVHAAARFLQAAGGGDHAADRIAAEIAALIRGRCRNGPRVSLRSRR
jgi:hypothetical protein